MAITITTGATVITGRTTGARTTMPRARTAITVPATMAAAPGSPSASAAAAIAAGKDADETEKPASYAGFFVGVLPSPADAATPCLGLTWQKGMARILL